MAKKICSIIQCDREMMAKGYCNAHYQQVRRGEYPGPIRRRQARGALCKVCGQPAQNYDLCREHFNDYMRAIPRVNGKRDVPEGKAVTDPAKPCPVEACKGTMGPREHVCYNHRRWGWRYGIKAPVVADLLNNAKCSNAGCGSNLDLVMDHDHACCSDSAKATCGDCNRGFLCRRCNTALGMLRDDPDVIQGLLAHLLG